MHTDERVGGSTGLLVRLWLIVALVGAVTLARSYQVGIPVRDPHGNLFWSRLGTLTTLCLLLAVANAVWRVGRRGESWSSPRTVAGELRHRWTAGRLALAAGALLGYQVVYLCYRNLKSWDVLNPPRDDMLLRWDRVLFLGHDPATLLHDLLGRHYAAYVLMVVYMCFTSVVTLSVAAAVALPSRVRDTYAFISSMALVWVLGVGCYYLIPSLGPFDSAPQLFRGLPHLVVQDNQARYMEQRAQLLAHPEWPDSFAQVSAFASLHTGVLCVIWLMARHFAMRRIARATAVLLAGTVVATIYLGWHFVVDDIAGVAIAVLAVAAGTRLAGSRPRTRGSTDRASGVRGVADAARPDGDQAFSPGRSGAARLRRRATPDSAPRPR